MAKQPGKDILLKIGDDASPETFATVMGLTTKTLSFNNEQVDTTDSGSVNRWRELLSGAGIRSFSASGEGFFSDTAPDESMRAAAMTDAHKNFQVIVPDFGTFEGPFQIATLEYTGEHNGAAQFSVSLESAGEITFAAAV